MTISTDDPNVTIDGVFMGGKPVAINSRNGNAVEVLVAPGPQGIDCARDLGLVLSDGRRIARNVDICGNGWQVVVDLGGPTSGGTTATQPPPPPPAPATAATGEAAPAAAGAQWLFTPTKDNGSLAFAVPGTNASEFTAVCSPASGEASVALGRSAPEVRPGASVSVAFAAGAFSRSYTATGSDVSETSGLSNPLLTLKTDDPLWPALIRENVLTVQIGSSAPYALSLKGSAAQAQQFLAYCSPAPPPVVAAPPTPGGNGVAFVCDDGSFIDVVFDDANQRVIVSEPGAPPLILRRVASRRGARYVAGPARLVGYAETVTWTPDGGRPSTCRPR